MFTGFRSRLMLSFSALLIICLGIVTVTFTLLFFVRVSLPQLAHAQLAEAAVPALAHVRDRDPSRESIASALQDLSQVARLHNVRILLVAAPEGRVVADTGEEWTGQRLAIEALTQRDALGAVQRGRFRAPDRRRRFYLALPLAQGRSEQPRRLYLALTTSAAAAARPFIGSMLASVGISGIVAFVLSILFAIWLAQALSDPLRRAAAAAVQVAAGDYGVRLDISAPDEAQRLAESFNTMTSAVANAQRTQRDFVANVSHELKTPLTSIQGFAQAILDGTADSPAAIARSATVIYEEASRLSRMALALLELARLESGQISIAQDRIDLAALLRSCANKFAQRAKCGDIELEQHIEDPLFVTGDGDRLVQAFGNLVDNALKYTPPGGHVTIAAQQDAASGRAIVSVADTGSGIPSEDLSRIFERFYQVDKSRSRDADTGDAGVGLGLAITLQIIQAHGGQIDVESIVDVGTRFTVQLPLALPDGQGNKQEVPFDA